MVAQFTNWRTQCVFLGHNTTELQSGQQSRRLAFLGSTCHNVGSVSFSIALAQLDSIVFHKHRICYRCVKLYGFLYIMFNTFEL